MVTSYTIMDNPILNDKTHFPNPRQDSALRCQLRFQHSFFRFPFALAWHYVSSNLAPDMDPVIDLALLRSGPRSRTHGWPKLGLSNIKSNITWCYRKCGFPSCDHIWKIIKKGTSILGNTFIVVELIINWNHEE